MNSAFSLLSVIIILNIIRPVVSGSQSSRIPADVCQTDQCRVVSEMLKNNMNSAVNPCNDFYEYVCGNFTKTNVPEGHITWFHFESMKSIVQAKVIDYLNMPPKEINNAPIRWAKHQFKACMNERQLNQLGIKPLLDKLKEAGGSTFYRQVTYEPRKEWHEIYDFYNRLTGKGGLFTIGVKYIPHLQEHMIVIDVTQDLFVHTPGSPRSKKFLLGIATEIHNYYNNSHLIKTDNETVKAILQFRESLAKIKDVVKASTRQSPVFTVDILQKRTNQIMRRNPIDWLHLLKSTFRGIKSVEIVKSTSVYILHMRLLLATLAVIDRTPDELISNHLHFNFLENYSVYSNVKMYKLFLKMYMKVLPPRSITCVSDRVLQRVFNYIYVQHFLPNETLAMGKNVVKDVERTLKDQISRTEWMSKLAKKIATDNVDTIYRRLKYNNWDKSARNIWDYYSDLPILNDYLQNALNFDSSIYFKELSLLSKQPYKNWNMRRLSASSNDDYPDLDVYADDNIELPVPVYEPPSFGVELPHAINYAGLGTICGKVLAAKSTRYEQVRSTNDYWDAESIIQYSKRLNFYGNRINSIASKEFGVGNVDFKFHVAHAVVKYISLVAAFEAYEKNKDSGHSGWRKLIGFENIADDKLFFVAYTMNRCEAINAQAFASKMRTSGKDVDLPFRLSVNVALSNMPAFADTFECKRDDPMNPSSKCKFFTEQ